MDSKEETKLLKKLIENTKLELVNLNVQEWVYEHEYETPVHIGKEEAKQRLELYRKRITQVQENLNAYHAYATANEIKL